MYIIDIVWEVAKWAWEHRKEGLTWATVSSFLLIIVDKMGRKLITNQLKRLFHVQDKSEFKTYVANQARIESKIDALMAAGGVTWDADYSNGRLGPSQMDGAAKNSSLLRAALWPVRIIVSFTRKMKEIFHLSGRYQRMSKFKSRKFLLALATGVLIVLNDGLGLGLDAETIMYVVTVVVGWIVGESGVDIARTRKEAKYDLSKLDEQYKEAG